MVLKMRRSAYVKTRAFFLCSVVSNRCAALRSRAPFVSVSFHVLPLAGHEKGEEDV